jgi:hypothetical protein
MYKPFHENVMAMFGFAAVLVIMASVGSAQSSLPAAPNSSQPNSKKEGPQKPEPPIQLIWLSNVQREPGEPGHGTGDLLFVFARGNVAAGGLMELEGSQQDPSPTCLTGSWQRGILTLQSDPASQSDNPIKVVGSLARTPRGYGFRGRIVGSIYDTPSGVILRQKGKDQTPDDVEQSLSDEECVCQWDRALGKKSFVTGRCKSPAEPGDKPEPHQP